MTGIFDFDQIDLEEAVDTLIPTFADATAFLRNHRCTLTCIAEEDRSMDECWEEVGISPYLLIPHAALLHNEAISEVANEVMDRATGGAAARLGHPWRSHHPHGRLHRPPVVDGFAEDVDLGRAFQSRVLEGAVEPCASWSSVGPGLSAAPW
ncbi:MAG: hypothetical protein C4551_03380 [Bacillota bacterium]|nr:MAG: hypothetical protein C4551_03380 [Bacillota bacterium]